MKRRGENQDTPNASPLRNATRREATHIKDHQLAPEGINVGNYAFDVTPNELIAAIITDQERGARALRREYQETL